MHHFSHCGPTNIRRRLTKCSHHSDLYPPAVTCIVQCERSQNCLEIHGSKRRSTKGMTRI